MNISKVNHVRVGAKVKEENGEGFIYKNPVADGKNAETDLGKHISKLNDKAKALYSPINPVDSLLGNIKDKTEKQAIKAGCTVFRKVVVGIVKNNPEGIPDENELIKLIKKEVKRGDLADNLAIANSRSVYYVGRSLRKSLAKYEDTAKLLMADILEGTLDESDKTLVKEFFDAVHEDYYKSNRLKLIEKSIVNKDVKVQVIKDDKGEKHLVLSNYDSAKKHFYFDFLKEFSSADSKRREEMIIRIRQLIILFYSGEEAYKLSIGSDIGAWTYGSSLPDVADNVDDKLAETIGAYCQENTNKDALNAKVKSLKNSLAYKDKKHFDNKKITDQVDKLTEEISDLNKDIRELKKKSEALIEEFLCKRFRESVKVQGLSDMDVFWLGYIQGVATKQFNKKEALTIFRTSSKYLYETTFNEWISFMALKYVDMGKAVYHFAMPDLYATMDGKEMRFGEVQPIFEEGITSFDYERIKAKESLTRNLATSATFAASIFANAVAEPEYRLSVEGRKSFEDPLQYKDKDWEEGLAEDAKRKLLMYFGGKSKWEDTELELVSDLEMTKAFQELINVIRNSNYHYAGSVIEPSKDNAEIIQCMFEKEFSDLGIMIREKYLSNNVPVFYGVEDIDKLMTRLYKGESQREAQVPSFGNVLKKKDMPSFVTQNIPANLLAKYNVKTLEQFRNSLYFVLKEIYYYGFLQETNLKERFMKALAKGKADAKNPDALEDFEKRISELDKDCSFGAICQTLMTDYNQQNQGDYKVKSQIQQSKDEDNNKGHKYSHYKMLLYVTIKNAFVDYLEEKADVYGFIKKPVLKDKYFESEDSKTFVSSWNADIFNEVKDAINSNSLYLAWYATAHMLSTKQLNLLQGDIRSFIQFINEINAREKSVFGRVRDERQVENIEYYTNILKVLEFVMFFAGKTSNDLTDYFKDEDDYALHLSYYVAYVGKKEEKTNSKLAAFCETKVKTGEQIGIYHNGTNPILNKNIVKAIMYGNENVLSGAITRFDMKTIIKYYMLQNELAKVFEKGSCELLEEQKKVREFQNLKNQIELHDISIFTEVINDYMSELVNMAYLRERDLMYYQLGYNYMKLEYGEFEDKYNVITGDNINIQKGAILYQITSLYTYDLPVIINDKDEYKFAKGNKIVQFVRDYCNENVKDLDIVYMAGLELFENTKLHDEYHCLRNDIDHLKYLVRPDKSILDLYSDIYNGFFSYDLKLKKSVSFIFSNILAKYFVIAETKMKTTTKNDKRYAQISIDSLESDQFTYKNLKVEKYDRKTQKTSLKPEAKSKIDVRGEEFRTELKRLLAYKND